MGLQSSVSLLEGWGDGNEVFVRKFGSRTKLHIARPRWRRFGEQTDSKSLNRVSCSCVEKTVT